MLATFRAAVCLRHDMVTRSSKGDASNSSGSWTYASAAEMSRAGFATQIGEDAGLTCNYSFKHACFGHARTNLCTPPSDALQRASRVYRGRDADLAAFPLKPLSEILQRVARKSPCALFFIGDSISHDTFVAAALGAKRLGWLRTSLCHVAGGPT